MTEVQLCSPLTQVVGVTITKLHFLPKMGGSYLTFMVADVSKGKLPNSWSKLVVHILSVKATSS